jgi:apolipoprotein N-acyltransferase
VRPVSCCSTDRREPRVPAQEAAAAGAQLVVLPEMWNCPYANESFPVYAEDVDGGASPSANALARAAADAAVTLVGGSIPERSGGRLYNTCLVYSPAGRLLAKHRKARPGRRARRAPAAAHLHACWPAGCPPATQVLSCR